MFTLATSVLTGLIFGSIPAFSSRFDVAPALRDGNRTTHSGQGLRNALIVAQVAASFMLLIASGLTLRSLLKLQSVNPGFRTENLLTVRADMSFNRFPLNIPRHCQSPEDGHVLDAVRGKAPRDSRRDTSGRRRDVPAQRAAALHGRLPARVSSAPAGRAAAAGRLLRRVARLFHRARPAHRGRPRVHALGYGVVAAGHHHQPVHGASLLAERESDRQARCGKHARAAC